eukprot:gnl/TRDRNA2_/TRDRNA2_179578_c0_seq1.p1 gnl/TRDRNA2_/TRDRNA2_179578_c0~~gnl/TRDRNA2_/TRDRNA2_179578_c0_seq1.p1  ORF type:complete len:463 (+),score=77.29 gnl/TRDRNA2_/TRDRNA2_179578_c0_seq1:123-1511(+)
MRRLCLPGNLLVVFASLARYDTEVASLKCEEPVAHTDALSQMETFLLEQQDEASLLQIATRSARQHLALHGHSEGGDQVIPPGIEVAELANTMSGGATFIATPGIIAAVDLLKQGIKWLAGMIKILSMRFAFDEATEPAIEKFEHGKEQGALDRWLESKVHDGANPWTARMARWMLAPKYMARREAFIEGYDDIIYEGGGKIKDWLERAQDELRDVRAFKDTYSHSAKDQMENASKAGWVTGLLEGVKDHEKEALQNKYGVGTKMFERKWKEWVSTRKYTEPGIKQEGCARHGKACIPPYLHDQYSLDNSKEVVWSNKTGTYVSRYCCGYCRPNRNHTTDEILTGPGAGYSCEGELRSHECGTQEHECLQEKYPYSNIALIPQGKQEVVCCNSLRCSNSEDGIWRCNPQKPTTPAPQMQMAPQMQQPKLQGNPVNPDLSGHMPQPTNATMSMQQPQMPMQGT